MKLTRAEQRVVQRLKKRKVETKQALCMELDVCHMTVVRAINKYGYYNSYNRNAAFYTLADIPDFDVHGLWLYRGIGFSKHGDLKKTLVRVVRDSPTGMGVEELEEMMNTRVANVLPRLCAAGEVARCKEGRRAVYESTDPGVRRAQQRARQRCDEDVTEARKVAGVTPPGLDAMSVIGVLVEMILQPKGSARSLASRLRAQSIPISPGQVETVRRFYGLEKKGAH